MTYTQLAPTTKLSELPAALNGITTRRERIDFVRHHDSVAQTARGTNGVMFQEGFALNEKLHCAWRVDDRADVAVDATLVLHFAMQTGGAANEEVAFDVGYITIDASVNDGSEVTTQTPTVVAGNDVDVSAFLAGGHYVESYTIPNAAFDLNSIVAFEVERVAVGGTAHASDVGLVYAEVVYAIER